MPRENFSGAAVGENRATTLVPLDEIHFDFVASPGPGGQNVNKVASKAELRWNIGESKSITPEQKNLIRLNLKGRLNKYDEIVITAKEERSQIQNKKKALELFQRLIDRSLAIPKERVATKPGRQAKEKRLEQKKRRAELKQRRQKTDY